MSELDDLAKDFPISGRKPYGRRGPLCEAISTKMIRCTRTGTRMRDGRHVCKSHFYADYPLTFHKEKP